MSRGDGGGGPSALRALAAHEGIIPSYVDQSGREERHTSDETRAALLAAMGWDVASEAAAARALAALEESARRRVLDPVRVVVREQADAAFHVPKDWGAPGAPVAYELELRLEDGRTLRASGEAHPGPAATVHVPLPQGADHGYHELHLALARPGLAAEARQRFIVVPAACPRPAARSVGVIANLYTLRGAHNWGIGNFGDLARLAVWSAAQGAAFVGVNPLHALRNRGSDISPYVPVSRLYRNPLYLDVEAIPEMAQSAAARAVMAGEHWRAELERVRASGRVMYEAIAALEEPVLRALHRAFAERERGTDGARGRAYAAYQAREGEPLRRFATHRALEQWLGAAGAAPAGWRAWPEAYRDAASSEVARWRAEHHEAVDFHQWVQFELDRQLADAAARGRSAGLAIGLYQDLALGSAGNGSDAWSWPALFVPGVSLGAPPDDYAAAGQNWGLPPLSPRRLADAGYDYWIALLRAVLRHSGAVRLDHVLGLFRQFWIPDGMLGREGAYVRFPTEDLMGILALESTRAGAIVVGEDLGTVPAEVPDAMRRWGVLGSRVLPFEREGDGRFRAAARWEPLALATADTHDMVPLEGWWRGRDIELRRELGLIESDAAADGARAAREWEKRMLMERLAEDGALPAGAAPGDGAPVEAIHRFLRSTPAALVGLSLDDLAREREPVNVPGVGPDRFPSWTRRMAADLDQARPL